MTTPLEDLVRLSEPEFFMAYPYDVFARLRAEAPVYWSERDRMWAVTRYEDVRFVSKSPQRFANRFGLAAGQTRTEDDGIAAAPDPVDFVDAVAAPVPMAVIARMLGVSTDELDDFRRGNATRRTTCSPR